MEIFKEYTLSGTPRQLADFLDRLSHDMPAGWGHSRRFEAMVDGTYDIFTRRATSDIPTARVALFSKKNGNNARVVNVIPDRGSLTIKQHNDVLSDFIGFATPLARQLGIQTEETSEQAEITRWISSEAADALLAFSNAANKSTGSGHPLDFDRWARFIIRVHREGSELSPSILKRYLVESLGWDNEKVDALGSEYEFSLALLKANDGID